MAQSGTVLGMLGGPEGADPGICIVWFRFLLLRRYLAYRPDETAKIGRLLDLVSGPLHLLFRSVAKIGFQRCSDDFIFAVERGFLVVLFLTSLSGSGRCSPWADDAVGIARNQLETALGSYVGAHNVPFEGFHLDGIDRDLAAGPLVWSDGSLVLDKVSGVGLLEQEFMLILLVNPGSIGGGLILICFLPCLMEGARLVDFTVPSLAPCSWFSVLEIWGCASCSSRLRCHACWGR